MNLSYKPSQMENLLLCILAAILGSFVRNLNPDSVWLATMSYLIIFIILYFGYRWIRSKGAKPGQ